jgi:phosphate starvation-inducible PhoH-like protein
LVEAINLLKGVEGIQFCHFEDVDVVRHSLVQRIIRAYEGKSQQQELPLGIVDGPDARPQVGVSVKGSSKPQ